MRRTKINYRSKKPWLTDELKNSIKLKNELYVLSRKYPTLLNINRYKEYKTILNNQMKRCAKDYYDKRFAMYKNNLRKSWALIKELINKKRVRDTFNTFVINEELTSDKVKIADAFNRFYTSIGPNLANKIPFCNKSPTSYIGESNPETISIIPVTQDEVNKKS